jgi:AraC-like DNA-binding protein
VSGNHLSQVINAFEHCSFRDFVNKARVTEVCRRLDESAELNLLELAMEVGFNSKSSFNRAFRKQTGKTPSEYISGS